MVNNALIIKLARRDRLEGRRRALKKRAPPQDEDRGYVDMIRTSETLR